MEIKINIFDDCPLPNTQKLILSKIIEFSLRSEEMPNDVEIGVHIIDADAIKKLNAEFRNIDEVTDVLSFPLLDKCEVFTLSELPVLLGDICICLSRAKIQADEYNHSIERELGFLCVHGLLHLLGYDHENPTDEYEMTAKQEKYLAVAGLKRDLHA